MRSLATTIAVLLILLSISILPYRIISSTYNGTIFYESVQYVPAWNIDDKTSISDVPEHPKSIDLSSVEGDKIYRIEIDISRIMFQIANVLIIVSAVFLWTSDRTKYSNGESSTSSSFPPRSWIMANEGARRLAQGVGTLFGVSLAVLALVTIGEDRTFVDGILGGSCAFALVFAAVWLLIRVSEWIYLGFKSG